MYGRWCCCFPLLMSRCNVQISRRVYTAFLPLVIPSAEGFPHLNVLALEEDVVSYMANLCLFNSYS